MTYLSRSQMDLSGISFIDADSKAMLNGLNLRLNEIDLKLSIVLELLATRLPPDQRYPPPPLIFLKLNPFQIGLSLRRSAPMRTDPLQPPTVHFGQEQSGQQQQGILRPSFLLLSPARYLMPPLQFSHRLKPNKVSNSTPHFPHRLHFCPRYPIINHFFSSSLFPIRGFHLSLRPA